MTSWLGEAGKVGRPGNEVTCRGLNLGSEREWIDPSKKVGVVENGDWRSESERA